MSNLGVASSSLAMGGGSLVPTLTFLVIYFKIVRIGQKERFQERSFLKRFFLTAIIEHSLKMKKPPYTVSKSSITFNEFFAQACRRGRPAQQHFMRRRNEQFDPPRPLRLLRLCQIRASRWRVLVCRVLCTPPLCARPA